MPAGFFSKIRTFTYRASDGENDSNGAVVRVKSGKTFEPDVLFEVPEMPWPDPGPYRFE